MQLLDLTLDTPAANLAVDEALLEAAELGEGPSAVLRLWESPQPMVVIGRSSRFNEEARVAACQQAGAPILRRCSGGAAIVAGPGCLMYAVLLGYRDNPSLRWLDQAHHFVLGRTLDALSALVDDLAFHGTSDLTLGDRKFSGNSLRCKRHHLLYHGTLLYDFPLDQIQGLLGTAPRQPDYRHGRDHDQFVTNLPTDAASIRRELIESWQAHQPLDDWPRALTERLVRERYQCDDWNRRL